MLPSKWENLCRWSTKLIHVCKKVPLALDCRQSKYSHVVYNLKFFNFGHCFCSSFPILFPKSPASCWKKFWNNFCCIIHTSIFTSSKSVSQIFKILFQTWDINIFILCGAFSRYVLLKSSFSDVKNISGEIWNTPL